jgi:integrase
VRARCVFSGRYGTHERRSHNEHGWFPAAVAKAGLPPLTPHSLRHTAVSLAVSAGANVNAVPRMLGHVSASMTLGVYSDWFDDDLDAVAGRLDEGLSQTVVGKLRAGRQAGEAETPQ